MAVKLIANYSKKLGLPGFSSHQFNVSVEMEINSHADIPAESERLYHTLQHAVDTQMQETGFVPDIGYGMNGDTQAASPASASGRNVPRAAINGNGHFQESAPARRTTSGGNGVPWKCSDKQREFITNLVSEHNLDRNEIDNLARDRFGLPVVGLNKLQASGLIDELLAMTGGAARSNGHAHQGVGGHPPRRNGGAG